MLSKVVSHQRLERPNGVSHLPWTPTRFATRICNATGHSDVTNAHRVMHHRCCASPMRDCTPNIAQHSSCPIRRRRTAASFTPTGRDRLARSPGCSARYCAQQSAHWTQKRRIAVCYCARKQRGQRGTACPLFSCRQHLCRRREAASAPKP